ncbi:hypothetical protein [Dethiosulfatarculus sandiegensis]|uniref:Uncharacterized protein n=1 Tax=Dethiosulfatarculus sandiegensis TaxID=1429043 RepID=A0A0D2J871_9BACT|nr:hypothetical protein [Dethiosulfatarculus sandiegensis]KIX11901.1 hypothetical protein X474_21835 [Dethiosulfatarculus sandiegensis]
MSAKGDWIANCLPDRVARISQASVFLLKVGPPRPNQMQTLDDLEQRGLVGLYRVGKKKEAAIQKGQESYLQESDFTPSPDVLLSFLGPLADSGNG